jgi:hypothetical protein
MRITGAGPYTKSPGDHPIRRPCCNVPPAVTDDATNNRSPVRTWAFALVPLLGLFELGAHFHQTHDVVPANDWRAARAAVDESWKPGDLVVFAPDWTDPLGREYFGEKLAGIPDEARPDDTRFARAFEVSIRGGHDPELAGWKNVGTRKTGAVTITMLENPLPVTLLDDLVAHASPTGMRVTQGGSDCRWVHGVTNAGNLGAGPATPGDRFGCPMGGFVGVSLIHDMTDRARRCFFAPTSGGRAPPLQVHFLDVAFGGALHGHAGLAQFNERDLTGPPVTLTWRAGDRILGKITHVDGDGWKGFELTTSELAGQRGELVAEVQSSGSGRQFCFEADTR